MLPILDVDEGHQMTDKGQKSCDIERQVAFGFDPNEAFWHFPQAEVEHHWVFPRVDQGGHLADCRKTWRKSEKQKVIDLV